MRGAGQLAGLAITGEMSESPDDDSEALSQEIEEEGLGSKNLSGLDENDHDGSELTASENDESWISWFINLRGHDYFCEVDEEYIQDDFNLTGLATLVPYYDYALDLMLDVDTALDRISEDQAEVVESAAIILYGLIHARFILTSRGMQRMVSDWDWDTPSFLRLTPSRIFFKSVH